MAEKMPTGNDLLFLPDSSRMRLQLRPGRLVTLPSGKADHFCTSLPATSPYLSQQFG
jgi:hypothetical protein